MKKQAKLVENRGDEPKLQRLLKGRINLLHAFDFFSCRCASGDIANNPARRQGINKSNARGTKKETGAGSEGERDARERSGLHRGTNLVERK
jgi:hypothetical protein